MKILIIDQCSSAKAYRDDFSPLGAETIDDHELDTLQDRPQTPAIEARKLYDGRQQRYINEAVDELRAAGDTVDRYFISAGFGLVEETERLPPYDVTFAEYSNAEINERAHTLGIENDLLSAITEDYEIIFFALGSDYHASFDLRTVLGSIPAETWAVCFNHESVTADFENALSLPARTDDAKEQGTIVVALKGRYLQQFASHRSQGKQVTSTGDIETYCTTEQTTQSGLEDHLEE
jgi:hypothetical protein